MDTLLPNSDTVNQTTFTPNPTDATSITVTAGSRFRAGDQVRPEGVREVMLVTGVSGNTLTVVRRYGGTTGGALSNGLRLLILGNAAVEGDDRPATQFTNRARKRNYTQIFSSSVEVSGSLRASRGIGLADELAFQKQERMRELIRDLENCVINGVAPASNPQGSTSVRRTMNGIIPQLSTNVFTPGQGPIPTGGGTGSTLSEVVLNAAMRAVWEQSSGAIDTIVLGGFQKRRVNEFTSGLRIYAPGDTRFQSRVSTYESDYGVCRLILSRYVPADTVLLLDSSRLQVMPLGGRSFHYKPLAATGDSEVGMVVGEYTLELKNESAHAVLRGLATS
ncbi:MAG: DUF5309 domain-containing protein [Phycisphaerales bacterium]|nr:DUF5309 domain-containing protein [Phycisphaerales bacterium]